MALLKQENVPLFHSQKARFWSQQWRSLIWSSGWTHLSQFSDGRSPAPYRARPWHLQLDTPGSQQKVQASLARILWWERGTRSHFSNKEFNYPIADMSMETPHNFWGPLISFLFCPQHGFGSSTREINGIVPVSQWPSPKSNLTGICLFWEIKKVLNGSHIFAMRATWAPTPVPS